MTPTAPSTAELLARAGWPAVSEAILAGLCHDLSNRAASLTGLVQLLEEGGGDMLEHLGTEVDRLGGSVERIRALNGRLQEQAEPLDPADVVTLVLDLHRRRRGLESVSTASHVADGLPPVLAGPSHLRRLLLILLDHVVSGVVADGGKDAEMEVTGSEAEVCFAVPFPGPSFPNMQPSVWDALQELAGEAGWALERSPDSLRLTLPSLGRARAAEA